jgi:hypothetical protein
MPDTWVEPLGLLHGRAAAEAIAADLACRSPAGRPPSPWCA